MLRIRRLLTSPGLWIPLILAGPILWALLPGGMPNTADGLVHFTRAAEMVHAWRDGVLIPRWAENLGLGYGIPLFVYAPPLPYFLTAGAHTLFGLPLDSAYKAMIVVAVLIAAYGAYRLGAELLGEWAGAVSVAAFLYAPILLRELFIQGNIAQYLAWAFTPWAAWAVIRIYAAPTVRMRTGYALALAVAVMGTLLSHNAAALIIVGMTAGLALALLVTTRDLRALLIVSAGGVLSLTLSAWFWVPALFEGSYVALDRIVASDFRPRFIAWQELVALSPRLDTGAINPYYPLTLGSVQVWLGVAGALLFLALLVTDWFHPSNHRKSSSRTNRVLNGAGLFFIPFTLFCAFMATAASEPVWIILPFVDLFEWPFRWHGFTAVGLAWLGSFVAYAARRMHARAEAVVALLAMALLLGAALVNLYPHKLAPGRPFSPAEVVRYESRTGAIGTTSLGEFNPIWVEIPFRTSPLVEDYRSGTPIDRLKGNLPAGASGEQTRSSAHRQEFRVELSQPATLTLSLLYFPGWRATVDGAPTPIRPHPGSGLVDVDVPAGEHALALTFRGTPLRRIAGAISVIAWLAFAVVALALVRPLRPVLQSPEPVPPAWHVIAGTAAVTAIAILVAVTQPQLFRLHSTPDFVLPARQPLRTDFAGQIRLLGVDPAQPVVKPRGSLEVVAYLRALTDVETDYTIFLHLDDTVTGETLATMDVAHPGGVPTSDWPTGLYVRSPLKITVPDDTDPIRYLLRLGFYDPNSGDLLSTADGDDVLEIGQIWVEDGLRPRTNGGRIARFGEPIELLSAEVDGGDLVLHWRTDEALSQDYSVFVHLLDASGNTIGQVDGAPYANRYPTGAWRPGQIIEDRRPLATAVPDPDTVQRIVVGLYDPATGERLPAVDATGASLPENALLLTP